MAVRKINKLTKTIVNGLFPALNESIGLSMYSDPITMTDTIATYAGDLKDKRVKLEFSSNHIELSDYNSNSVVFTTVYYGFRGTKVGVLNLTDINECVGLIYAGLYELGFRTDEDLEREKQEKEEKERQEKEAKKAEEEKKLAEKRARQQAEEEKERLAREQREQEPEVTPEEEMQQSIEEGKSDFDKYLSKLKQTNSQKSQIMANISFSTDVNSFRVINIDMFYRDQDFCLVQTTGINPKVDKEVTWDKAKAYIFKVTEAVKGVISIGATGADGEEIDISDMSDDSDNIDVGFNL